jgi:hypothetical protein
MVWVTFFCMEVLSFAVKKVRMKLKGGVMDKPLTILDHMIARSGLSKTVKTMNLRAVDRYQKELEQCKSGTNDCAQRTFTRGARDFSLTGTGNSGFSELGGSTTSWRCNLVGEKGKQECVPPQTWWDQMQNDLNVRILALRDDASNLFAQRVETADKTEGQKTMVDRLKSVFGSLPIVMGVVFAVSVMYGTMCYYTVVWHMAKIKGRCSGDKSGTCARDLMEMAYVVDDMSDPNAASGMQALWDPIAQGTMGWVAADVLMSSLFL